MADDKKENPDGDFTRIKPLAIDLSTQPSAGNAAVAKPSLKHSPLIWLGLGILFTASLVVIFLLPHWVSPPQVEQPTPAAAATSAPQIAHKSVNKGTVSPWEKAQESRLRKETQDILSQMLDAQKVLAEKAVTLWAADDYARAMADAAKGDASYNQQDFANARAEYEKALDIFSRLVKQIDDVFAATMEKGNKALAEGDANGAKDAFKLALAIDAIDRAANIGLARAKTLDEVRALVDKGDKLLEAGQFDQAKNNYQQALALDSYFATAKQKIQLADKKILERKFNRYMSAGFAAMQKTRYSQAHSAFARALRLKPQAAAARAALEQSQHELTTIKINTLLAAARTLDEQEKWHEALTKYNAALTLDSSLAEAQAGRQRATLRAKIHDRLERILAQPKRLYDREVFMETLGFEKKLLALANRGPVLNRQLDSLGRLLNKATTPVEVTLQSDNLTRVTLRKVGELGFFVKKHLSLRPGKYVAVGIREGYRDVRKEFMLEPDHPPQAITVQAAEKIALDK